MKTNELKCTDLRIGNYVNYENRPFEVIEISPISLVVRKKIGDIFEMQHRALDVAQPIELTEEVLLKIGFKKNKYDWLKYFPDRENEISILMTENYTIIEYVNLFHCPEDVTEVNYGSTLEFPRRIYLHQLQNAYYLLTNEELEVEL